MNLKAEILSKNDVLSSNFQFFIDYNNLIEIYGNSIKFIGIIEKNNIVAIMYYYLKNYKVLNIITTPPFLPFTEIVFTNLIKQLNKNYHKNTFYKNILSELAIFFKKHYKFSIVKLTFQPSIVDMQPFYWNNYKVIPFYTYQINLNNSVEAITSHFSSKKISLIQKAIKDNLTVRISSIEDLKKMVYLTFLRKKLTNKYEIFVNFVETINKSGKFKVFSCFRENELFGSCGFLEHNDIVYYMFSGYSDTFRHPSTISFILYKAIEFYKINNFSIFDFEGSMLKDVEVGFREFGGEILPYYSANYANLFLEILLKFKYRNRF